MIKQLAAIAVIVAAAAASASTQDFDAKAALNQARAAAAGAPSPACTAVETQMTIPLEKGLKVTLTDAEKAKFLAVAAYAKTAKDHKISAGTFPSHGFEVYGGYAQDGSFQISEIDLTHSVFGNGIQFIINADGSIQTRASEYSGHILGKDHDLRDKDIQALITSEIAFWMSYKIPR